MARALAFLVLLGCGQDQCEQLCSSTATALDACLDEWPADWSDLDASIPEASFVAGKEAVRGVLDGIEWR